MNREIDVLLAGYYGFGNLGDELLAESAVRLLQECGVKRERIALLSASPRVDERTTLKTFNRWSFSEVYGALKKSRSLLLGGGGLFQDSTSVKSCLYYWGLCRLALFCGARPWAVGQSIGPLHSRAARWLAKNAFSTLTLRGVRDNRSLEQLDSWGMGGALSLDLAMGLALERCTAGGGTLLLNLRPGYDVQARAGAQKALAFARRAGLSIKGVAFSQEDVLALDHFLGEFSDAPRNTVHVKSLSDFERESGGASCALGMRLHFIILSFLSGLPVCAIPYDPKVNSLAMEYNIPMLYAEYGAINFSEISDGGLQGVAREKLLRLFSDGLRKALDQA